MEKVVPCERHEEQIKTLFKRVESMDNFANILYSLDKSYALQSQVLQQMSDRNDRQDERMDKQDKRMEEYQKVIVSVNDNLTELTEGQRFLNDGQKNLDNQVKSLKQRVEQNEEKHLIDTRDIDKEKKINFLKKWGVPMSVGIAVGTFLLRLIEIFKV